MSTIVGEVRVNFTNNLVKLRGNYTPFPSIKNVSFFFFIVEYLFVVYIKYEYHFYIKIRLNS